MSVGIFELIFKWGARRRNPSIFKIWEDLRRTDKLSYPELLKLQEERLQELLRFSLDNSAFYKELYAGLHLDPDVFKLSDLKKLPVIAKKQLISEGDSIRTDHKFNKLFYCETSGTSGEVLNFVRNEYWDSFNRAAVFRAFEWYGVKPWEFNIYFWGYNTGFVKKLKIRLMDFLVNRWRVFDYKESTLKRLGRKLRRARFIEGYSSMIYELAKLSPKNRSYPFLRLVKGTSEKIYPHYKDETLLAFGVPIVNEYGAAESGLIAFECPDGNMHMNMEGCIVETDENDEILITNLMSHSFPIIRYKLGDVVKLKPEEYRCSCGREHRVIEEVTGRIGKTIYGKAGLYPSLTLYYIFKNLYFNRDLKLNYQGHQTEKGRLELWLDNPVTPEIERAIREECEPYFGSDLEIVLKEENNFRLAKGKLRDFITTLD